MAYVPVPKAVSYTHLDVYKRQERVLVIDDRDTPLTLADERIARAIRENSARLVIIDPVQAPTKRLNKPSTDNAFICLVMPSS